MKSGMKTAFHPVADLNPAKEMLSRPFGVEVRSEPADQPWGVRDGTERDPSGDMARIEQA